MVTDYFTQQIDILNIDKLKQDFQDFYSKMTDMEARMSHKMKEVEILYDEVSAGFARNARDRSDYLVHYERLSNMTESNILNFKDQLLDHKHRQEKLSTIILSIVNEEEAQQMRAYDNGV